MTFIWLIVWLIQGTPAVEFQPDVNSWAIGLAVCIAIDLIGARAAI